MSATPTLEQLVNELIDQRLRSMQTAYPAEIVSYDASEATATVKPMFLEVWRGPNDERITEPLESEAESYVENVLVAFPRMGNFRIVYPIAAGDQGLVIVTKYSLDRFRDGGGQADPGDMTRFGMSGSVFIPLNLSAVELDASAGNGDTDIYLGAGGASDYLALKKDVDDIKTFIDNFQTTFNNHTHGPGTYTTDAPATVDGGASAKPTASSESYTPTYSKNVKVESN